MALQPNIPEKTVAIEGETRSYSILISLYQRILTSQLKQELGVNTAALPHQALDNKEKAGLRIRNLSLEQGLKQLNEIKTGSVKPEETILKVAATINRCPPPQTHEYINGETRLSFTDEPDLFALTNLVKTVEPLAQHPNANPQFVKYFDNLRNKYSQVLLKESLVNSRKRGFIGITKEYLPFDPTVSEKELGTLHKVFVKDIQQFARKHRKFMLSSFPAGVLNTEQDFFPELTALLEKVSSKGYVMGASELQEYMRLTKNHPYFKPASYLKDVSGVVEDTQTLDFDSIRTKKAVRKVAPVILFAQLFALGGGIVNQQHFADSLNHTLSQPDGDPLRMVQATGNLLDFGHYLVENRDQDPVQNVMTYLEDPDHVKPVASYLLYDYFESLEHFPEADRARLVDKATNFVNEVASRYQAPNDPNHDALAEYLLSISEDQEMQDLLGYTVLPALAYVAENEDSFAQEQWLYNAQKLVLETPRGTATENVEKLSQNPHIQAMVDKYLLPYAKQMDKQSAGEWYYYASIHLLNGDYEKLIPYLEKAVTLLTSYDPDNIVIDFDNPDTMYANGETITVPHSITEALNSLPPNPNYLGPEEFLQTSQEQYQVLWREIYGKEVSAPPLYWSPVKVQPPYVNQDHEHFIDTSVNRQEGADNYHFQSEENRDWFTRATIDSPSRFSDVYNLIPEGDPYRSKFGSEDGFLLYFQDYSHFITANGTPEKPILETDLFAYALVKCNGNYTEAKQEMAILYKLLARYDIESGLRGGHLYPDTPLPEHTDPEQHFYRTKFIEVNLPILLSVTNQSTSHMADYNEIFPLLRQLDIRLVDHQDDTMYSEDETARGAYDFGAKDIDWAEMFGIIYHIASQDALVSSGIANPAAIAINHAIGEIPFWLARNDGKLDTTENSSNKASAIALAGLDLIKLRHVLRDNLSVSYPDSVNTSPQINMSVRYTTEAISEKNVIELTDQLSVLTVPDPENPYQITIYSGNPEMIKLLSEKGYAPVRFSDGYYDDPTPCPNLLEYYLDSGVEITYFDSLVDRYADEDQLQVAQMLLEHYPVTQTPDNLGEYLKLGLDIPIEDINTLIGDPSYYGRIADALPYLSQAGIVKPDHHLVKSVIEQSTELTYNYYRVLNPDQRYILAQIYPEIPRQMEAYVLLTIEDLIHGTHEVPITNELVDEYFTYLFHALRGDHKDTALDKLNFLLPYLDDEQLSSLLDNSRLTSEDLIKLLDPGYIVHGSEDKYTNLQESIPKIAKLLENQPNLLLFFSPALLSSDVWDIKTDHAKIDDLITQCLVNNNFAQLVSTSTLRNLHDLGYMPNTALIDQLVAESSKLLQSPEFDSYSLYGIHTIYGYYASPIQFTDMVAHLATSNLATHNYFAGQLFYERFGRYDNYYSENVPTITQAERELLNQLIADDTIRPHLGGEGGLLSTYYAFADYLTEDNALQIYSEVVMDLTERSRYELVNSMQSHHFSPPKYSFDHDKFMQEIYGQYTSERWAIFESTSNDFVRDNLTFEEYVDIFKFLTEDRSYFEMYITEDAAKVFDHDYFATIPGYSRELENSLVDELIDQLSETDMENVPYQSYYFMPYIFSQRPDFDYGPYFVAWINSYWSLENVINDSPVTLTLFIETAKHIKPEYWAEIQVADIEKYSYLQKLLNMQEQPDNTSRRR